MNFNFGNDLIRRDEMFISVLETNVNVLLNNPLSLNQIVQYRIYVHYFFRAWIKTVGRPINRWDF